MKRIISLSLILLLLLTPLLCGAASAESRSELPYYVSDTAHLIPTEQWQKLEDAAEQVSGQYGCGVYVLTLNDYRDYGSYNGIRAFSEDFYNRYQLGIGEARNGILLVLSMTERDYSLIAYGGDAHYAFTDYGKEALAKSFLDDFSRNDWVGGCSDYINGCAELLSRAAEGNPLDVGQESGLPPLLSTAIGIVLPLLVAFGVCEGMKHKMKPVRPQSRADEYVVPGGVEFSQKRDTFINRTVTRSVIRTENRDSSGGGGTTVNSQGFSGQSGKF